MQRSLRMNELQLFALSEKALNDNGLKGYLFKRSTDSGKWQCRYFVQFQNLLFYYESDSTSKPSGVIFLEGSYCEKVTQQQSGRNASQVSARRTVHVLIPLISSRTRRKEQRGARFSISVPLAP